MTAPMHKLLTWAAVVAAGTLLLGGPAHAADEGSVLQGAWNVKVDVRDPSPAFQDISGTWTYDFGAACVVGETCDVDTADPAGQGQRAQLTPTAQGFTFTRDVPLDCYDQVTGELSTVHGADYHMTGNLRPAATETRDGVTYVSSLTGTLVETIKINAKGLADNCQVLGQSSVTQRSVLTGTPVPLPDPPAGGTSTEPAGVDPASASSNGTLPEFTLPRSDAAARSAEAVAEERRSSVPGALTVPTDAVKSAVDRLPLDLLLVALLALLIVFPAQIFNSTYEENHERIQRAFRRFRPRRARAPETEATHVVPAGPGLRPDEVVPEAARQPRGRVWRIGLFVLCAVVGTVLGGLLDPGFGPDRPSAALLLGVFAALVVAVLVAAGAGWLFRTVRRHPHDWYLRPIPSALLVAVLCVLVSRLTHFEPGYLYGILGGAVFVGALARRSEGRAETVTLLAGLGLALAAWMVFEPVAAAANDEGASFGTLVADSFLGCLFIGGIEGLLFSLIPLRFLPGYRVRQWGWIPWGVLTAVTTYLFVHVLLIPESGYLGRSTTVSANVTIALFVAFGVASTLFWAWFRFRPDPADKDRPTAQPGVPPAEAPLAVPS